MSPNQPHDAGSALAVHGARVAVLRKLFHNTLRTLALASLLSLACVGELHAEEIPLTLPANSPPSRTIDVPDSGCQYILTLLRKGGQNSSPVTIYATDFVGIQGDSIAVGIHLPGDRNFPALHTLTNIALADSLLRIVLEVPSLSHPGVYSGSLIVTALDKTPLVINLALQHTATSRPATIAVSPQLTALQITKPLLIGSDPYFTVTLRDKTSQVPIRGIYAEIESVAKAPAGHFDIGNVILTVDQGDLSTTADGLFTPYWRAFLSRYFSAKPSLVGKSNAPKDITRQGESPTKNKTLGGPVDGHVTLRVTLVNLASGEYDAVLRFHAENAADDEGQKFHIIADVRDPCYAGLIALVLALSFSFVGTKFVSFRKKSLELQQRILNLNAPWLMDQSAASAAFVCARAILSQCNNLSRRFWLSGATMIDDLLAGATGLDLPDFLYHFIS